MTRLHKMIVGLLVVGTVLGANVVAAEELIVSFGTEDAAPFVFLEGEELVEGIIKDVMDAVGRELEIDVIYKPLPRKRIEPYMLAGKVHIIMNSNPAWVQDSEQYDWSVPLFQELNWFVVAAERAFSIKTFDDLNGKRLGTILGHYYPGLMEKFERQEIFRDDNTNFEANFKKLQAGRIDSLISSNILITYYLKQHNAHDRFVIAEKVASSHDIQAMISRHSPVPSERLNAEFQRILENGRMAEILGKYK